MTKVKVQIFQWNWWLLILTRALYTVVVVWIDADLLLFGAKGIFTPLQGFQLMVGLKVRPAPHSTVDNVRKPFPVRNLQPAIQGSWNGNALAGLTGAAQGFLQVFHGALLLFQLFHKCIHSLFCPFLFLVSLLPPKQPLDCWACERKEARHGRHLGQGGFSSNRRASCVGVNGRPASVQDSQKKVTVRMLDQPNEQCKKQACGQRWGWSEETSLVWPRTGSRGGMGVSKQDAAAAAQERPCSKLTVVGSPLLTEGKVSNCRCWHQDAAVFDWVPKKKKKKKPYRKTIIFPKKRLRSSVWCVHPTWFSVKSPPFCKMKKKVDVKKNELRNYLRWFWNVQKQTFLASLNSIRTKIYVFKTSYIMWQALVFINRLFEKSAVLFSFYLTSVVKSSTMLAETWMTQLSERCCISKLKFDLKIQSKTWTFSQAFVNLEENKNRDWQNESPHRQH